MLLRPILVNILAIRTALAFKRVERLAIFDVSELFCPKALFDSKIIAVVLEFAVFWMECIRIRLLVPAAGVGGVDFFLKFLDLLLLFAAGKIPRVEIVISLLGHLLKEGSLFFAQSIKYAGLCLLVAVGLDFLQGAFWRGLGFGGLGLIGVIFFSIVLIRS